MNNPGVCVMHYTYAWVFFLYIYIRLCGKGKYDNQHMIIVNNYIYCESKLFDF